jgi:apolipoprotein N-acyltransferase
VKIALSESYPFWLLTSLAIALAVIGARIPALHWLTFFWILPFAFVLPRLQLKQAIIISAFCGIGYWIGSTYWLVAANIYFAQSETILVIIVFLLFCLWQALPYILLGTAYGYFNWNSSHLGPLLAASILTVVWILIPTPIPLIPQNSLYIYPKFVAVLDLSGISFLLFLSTLFCFSIEYSLRKEARFKKQYMVLVLAIPLLMLWYGEIRQTQLDADKANAKPQQWLHIGYVQPALLHKEKFDLTYHLTEQLIQEKSPDLIIWPEIAAPYSFINNEEDRRRTLSLANKYQQDIIAVSGYVLTEEQKYDAPTTYYNQAQLIKDGGLQGGYSKEILVPFFEYMPRPLNFLRKWMPNVLYYKSGKHQQPLSYKDNIKLVMAICYEIIFPEYIRSQVNQGGNIIINPADDAVFKQGIGSYYHLSTAYFRSIENRVPWVRSTNTGVSIIVAADGKPLTRASELGQVGAASTQVFIPLKASVYSRFGDVFTVLLLVVWLLYYALRKLYSVKQR